MLYKISTLVIIYSVLANLALAQINDPIDQKLIYATQNEVLSLHRDSNVFFKNREFDKAFQKMDHALQLSKQLGIIELELKSIQLLVEFNFQQMHDFERLELIQFAIKQLEKRASDEVNTLILAEFYKSAFIFLLRHYPEMGIHQLILNQLLRIIEVNTLKDDKSKVESIIGTMYFNLLEMEEAERWLEKGYSDFVNINRINNQVDTLFVLQNGIRLAHVYVQNKATKKAFLLLDDLKSFADKTNQEQMIFFYANYAQLLQQSNEFEQAIDLFKSLFIQLDETNASHLSHFEIAYRLALTYFSDLNNSNEALKWGVIAFSYSDSLQLKSQIKLFELLESIYLSIANFEKAHHFAKKQLSIDTKIYEAELQQKLLDLKIKLDSSKIALDYESLKKVQVTERNLLYVFISFSIILIILIAFFIQSNKRTASLNRILAEQHLIISEQKQELEQTITTKDRILSIIGHDLRGPVSTMYSYLDLLSDEETTHEIHHEIKNQLQMTIDSSLNLLDNLVYWGQSLQNSIHLYYKSISLNELMLEVINQQHLVASSKRIKLINNCDTTIQLITDERLLSVILRNLISNAIKFTPENGQIQLGCEQSDSKIRLYVKDSGVGMSKELIQSIESGSAFSKVGTKNEKGFGLGLQLVNMFTKRLNGKLRIVSTEKVGTTISVEIPVENSINHEITSDKQEINA